MNRRRFASGSCRGVRSRTIAIAWMRAFPAASGKRPLRTRESRIDGLILSGLTELALGALTGWPMAMAVSRPHELPKIGIRSPARLRQWHLDLIMLGSLTAAAPVLVPNPPRKVALPLAAGAWVNANAFGVLAFRPGLKNHPVYRRASRHRSCRHLGASPGWQPWPGNAGWNSDEPPRRTRPRSSINCE